MRTGLFLIPIFLGPLPIYAQDILTLKKHNDVQNVSFSPDGKRIVSGSRDNTIKVWDVSTVK